ncbi:hypothetical protein UY3_13935 [Chelonia mydas]|uniref:Uncharacterized protein n=1 Tax=Chelonia mydas TaxID=8469 RepID=M7BL48_CHEMY|nr:hypothetical protein UY3_13935 [Chelonia mydas]
MHAARSSSLPWRSLASHSSRILAKHKQERRPLWSTGVDERVIRSRFSGSSLDPLNRPLMHRSRLVDPPREKLPGGWAPLIPLLLQLLREDGSGVHIGKLPPGEREREREKRGANNNFHYSRPQSPSQ